MIKLTVYEWYALTFCSVCIVGLIVWSWLYGRGCCRDCEIGRRCKCQGRAR